jgi:hypothetical protein
VIIMARFAVPARAVDQQPADQEVQLAQPHECERVGGDDDVGPLGEPEDRGARVEDEHHVRDVALENPEEKENRLIFLNVGLSVILAFIGVKLLIEALHGSHVDALGPMLLPHVGIATSLGFILVILAVTVVASLGKQRRDLRRIEGSA